MTTDTSLRRRARELLAAEYEREGIIGGVREGASHIDRAAVRAIEAALSHPQPDTPAQSQQESTNQKWIDRAEAKLAAQQAVAVPDGVWMPRCPVAALPILHALSDAAGLERLPDPNDEGSYPITGKSSTVRQWYDAMLDAAAPVAPSGGLREIAKRNLRKMIELGSTDKKTMLSCLEELS